MRIILLLSLVSFLLYADRAGGPYIGAGYALSSYNDDGYNAAIENKKEGAFVIYGGAYINKYLSVEFLYDNFGRFVLAQNGDQKIEAYTISTLFHYPLFEEKLDLFLKFGVGEIRVDTLSQNGFTNLYGAALAYRFNDTFALRLGYDSYHFTYDAQNSQSFDMQMGSVYSAIEVQF